jgi:hypothetical protein
MRDGSSPKNVELVQRAVTFPPHNPGRHGWAELLTLVGAVRRLAFDRTLDDADRARRIRDRFGEYDGRFDGDC